MLEQRRLARSLPGLVQPFQGYRPTRQAWTCGHQQKKGEQHRNRDGDGAERVSLDALELRGGYLRGGVVAGPGSFEPKSEAAPQKVDPPEVLVCHHDLALIDE